MTESNKVRHAVIKTKEVLNEIGLERLHQDRKWGEQNHGNFQWNTILSEEVGESAKEALDGTEDKLREELIQVAAVAVAWIESIDRNHR